MSSVKPEHLSKLDSVISTLGPSGTDSAHEARKHCSNVLLFPSFVAWRSIANGLRIATQSDRSRCTRPRPSSRGRPAPRPRSTSSVRSRWPSKRPQAAGSIGGRSFGGHRRRARLLFVHGRTRLVPNRAVSLERPR